MLRSWIPLVLLLGLSQTIGCSGSISSPEPVESEAPRPGPRQESATEVRYRPASRAGDELPVRSLAVAVLVDNGAPPHLLYLEAEPRSFEPSYCSGPHGRGGHAVAVELRSLEPGTASVEVAGMAMQGVSVGVHEGATYRGYGFQQGDFEIVAKDEHAVRGTVRITLSDDAPAMEQAGLLRGSFVARRIACP